MHPDTDRRFLLGTLTGVAGVAALSSMARGGPLNPPPGPVTSTPPIEPRIPLSDQNTPGTATARYRITQPGSYYLPSHLSVGVPNGTGIEIASDGVTLDLCGFSISTPFGGVKGIAISGNRKLISIRNGRISVSAFGIYAGDAANNAQHMTIEDILLQECAVQLNGGGSYAALRRVVLDYPFNNGSAAVSVGPNSLIDSCRCDNANIFAESNVVISNSQLHSASIEVNGRAHIVDCIASGITIYGSLSGSIIRGCALGGDSSQTGIDIFSVISHVRGLLIQDCAVTTAFRGMSISNVENAVVERVVIADTQNVGITLASNGGVIRDCSVTNSASALLSNSEGLVIERSCFRSSSGTLATIQRPGAVIRDCSFLNSADIGVDVLGQATGAVFDRCTFSGNAKHGLRIAAGANGAVIRDCQFRSNAGNGASFSGLLIDADSARVDGCHITAHTGANGFTINGSKSVFVRNSFSSNGTNGFLNAANHQLGQYHTTTGVIPSTVGPWANFSLA